MGNYVVVDGKLMKKGAIQEWLDMRTIRARVGTPRYEGKGDDESIVLEFMSLNNDDLTACLSNGKIELVFEKRRVI